MADNDIFLSETSSSGFAEELEQLDRSDTNFIVVRDGRLKADRTLMHLGMDDQLAHEAVIALAARGFFMYFSGSGESRFVRRRRVPTLWKAVLENSVKVSADGVFYSLEASHSAPTRSLVVVFSGVTGDPHNYSLWRYFTPNYRYISASLPDDAAVLRIADLGGGDWRLLSEYRGST